MVLEGVVTNVAAFGAFVDVGVHQDGLVHVSALSKTFVKDPREVVKSGDIVRVKVLDVDVPRKRISLTLRLDDDPASVNAPRSGGGRPPQQGRNGSGDQRRDDRRRDDRRRDDRRRDDRRRDDRREQSFGGGALADALRRAGLDKGLDGLGKKDGTGKNGTGSR